ncbi:MAG: zinc-ribbon domain-containing protein [Abitibacteriaceae bacterium]|nr:zinc-ribbon domain-containing protein [Abditibacteriaceae bacterium]
MQQTSSDTATHCRHCGKPVQPDYRFCISCGTRLTPQSALVTVGKTLQAGCLIALALPFGLFGACGLLNSSMFVLQVLADPSRLLRNLMSWGFTSILSLGSLALAVWMVRRAHDNRR